MVNRPVRTTRKLYSRVEGLDGNVAHFVRNTGPDGVFPRGLCNERIRLREPDPEAEACRQCYLIATTEVALAAEALGFTGSAVAIATGARKVLDGVPME